MRSSLSFVYLGTSLFLIVLSLFMGGLWLINTQVAFISSMIVIFASFFSYKGMIEKRLENGEIPEDRDELDKIDDKFRLFEEEEFDKELSKDEFVKYYKTQRKKSSNIKQSLLNLFKSGRGIFNPFRLMAYALLCIAMLFLIKNSLFSAVPFLVGIGAIPISIIIFGFFIKSS